jgi:hypothetical protein
MKQMKILVLCCFAMMFVLPFALPTTVESQSLQEAPTVPLNVAINDDNIFLLFNGFGNLGAPLQEGQEPVPLRSFRDNLAIFNEQESIDDGLGPVYNARSCGDRRWTQPDRRTARRTNGEWGVYGE